MLAGIFQSLARGVVRVMPSQWRKHRWVAGVGLWGLEKELRRYFDDTEQDKDSHVHWVAIQGAASILTRLHISHPEKDAGPDIWRPFLAHIVNAAEAGDITSAQAVMARPEWSSMNERSHFGAPSPPPPSTQASEGSPGHPGGRIYTARAPAEILDRLKDWTTTLDMKQFAQRHVGKWIRVQNTIRDIDVNGSTIFFVVGRAKFAPVVHLAFSREKWQSHLESMDRGDRIAAEGIIANIEYPAMYLNDCELVDEREEDDPF